MSRWRSSPLVAATAVVLFVIVQLAIPLTRLGTGEPQRLGWQMFSTAGDPIEFIVHTSSGSREVDLELIMARVRGDMVLDAIVPPFVCETTPGAVRVTWDGGNRQC